jgi:sulfite reductase (ferredoxin)
VLQDEYLEEALPDGPAPAPAKHDQRDHVGVSRQKDGRNAVGFALRTGRITGSLLTTIADLADRYGQGRIRTTT